MAKEDEIFSEENEVKIVYKTVKFGRVGDFFKGTLIGNTKKMANNMPGKKGMQTLFEFKMREGSLHLIHDRIVDKDATKLETGEDWTWFVDKDVMLKALKPAKIGQIIGAKFVEEKKGSDKTRNPAKIIKVYGIDKPVMDTEWLASQEAENDIDIEM